ncbi:MAG: DsbA family protein [Sandarakinorhabdus sp.]|nr:DsbA family protein [Sandarakinorhabdus sp.]
MKISAVTILVALATITAACSDKAATPASSTATSSTTAASTSATPLQAGTDWTTVAAATPDGGFRLGNPDAKVKLVEFASLTCPHCRDFHAEAFDAIKSKYVASGNVSYEYRNFVLNGPDYAASMLARCQGAEPFFGLLSAFYRDQTVWTEPFGKMTAADNARLSAMPQDRQIAALAETGKLDEYVRSRGITRAKFDACLADKGMLDKLLALRSQATDKYKLTGTPGFIINGVVQENTFTWAELEPKLQAAVK